MTIPKVAHRIVSIDGLDIFYREAGPKNAPYSGPRKLDHQLSYSGGPGKG